MTWRGISFPPKQSLHGGAPSLPRIRDCYGLISTGVPALGAQRKEVLQAALGRAFKLLAIGSGVGLVWVCLRRRCWLSQATPRDPLVFAGVVLAMLLLGLVATWIPVQRARSVNPLVLLREE